MCDTFAISGIYDTFDTLLTFHQKSYDITVQSNFVSAQTVQWELYFQCSFRDKLPLKEKVFFIYLKTGSVRPYDSINMTKIQQ